MFTRATAALLLALPILAAAQSNLCTTGTLLCCQSTGTLPSSIIIELLDIYGVPLEEATGLVGISCSPITVIGTSSTVCNEQPVCCTNNSFNGVIALGCSPINLNI